MTDIASLATKIEAAKLAGNGIALSADELDGLLRIAALLVQPSPPAPVPVDDTKELECITTEELCKKLRIERRTLWRWRKEGKFPLTPVNPQGSRWLLSDLVQWQRAQRV